MLTPDFDIYEMRAISDMQVSPLGLTVHYADGAISHHLAADLREHCPQPHTTHPVTRETLLSPLDVPDGFHITRAALDDDGMVAIEWSATLSPEECGLSLFHPGWLYQTGCSAETDFGIDISRQLWNAADFEGFPILDGAAILEDEKAFFTFLAQFIRTGAVIVRPAANPGYD